MNIKSFFIRWSRKRTIYMGLILALAIGPLLHSYRIIPSLNLVFFNFTRSAPRGMYITAFDQLVSKGDYVILHPPEMAHSYLYGRLWTEAKYMLKPVAAFAGEKYVIRKHWLMVGDKSARIYTEDPDGLPLESFCDGEYIVPDDMVLLIAWDVPTSFDSRYFGPIRTSTIFRKVWPVLIIPTWAEKLMS